MHEINYDNVKEILSSGQSSNILIDVRGKDEFDAGNIPTSHNIPVAEIKSAFELDDASFKSKYGFDKPHKNDPKQHIVLYCMSGIRSKKSAGEIGSLGYTDNVLVYTNGWSEYGKKN
ncbi:putative thiosulfate sulfurtransferase, mitochondrial [Smittium mucronatum]|uniref:Putative thiosulfate sulfurtransferase, mitochondrial n=1 Tax=Smittium mucronatum TaxID=133383 RepID=A0A1R0H386_9FUNG|nr:putative thiosulfate sulfurtransferase, mitochondrial [Smittium mucronatum]